MKDIKFGVNLSFRHIATGGWEAIRDLARECERIGYHSIWLADHLTRDGLRLECWTALSALSTTTEEIRLGTSVLCNSFRNSSLLAKMAASLDVISGGRLEFGIGAGFYKPEYQAYGFPFPRLSVRVKQLEEGLEIIKRMWTRKRPSYKGKYYQIHEAICDPKPIQKPHPPITIGGGSEKYTLKVVAKHADRWDFLGSVKLYQKKMSSLRKHCAKVGRDFREIEKSCFFHSAGVYENDEELIKVMRKIYQREDRRLYDRWSEQISFEAWLEEIRSRSVIGTPEECLTRINDFIDLGVTFFILRFVEPIEKKESLRLFANKVIKKLP